MKTIFYSITFWLLSCQIGLVKANGLPPFPCDSFGLVDALPYLNIQDSTYEICLRAVIKEGGPRYHKDPYQCIDNLITIELDKGANEAAINANKRLIEVATSFEDSISAYSSMIYLYRYNQELSKAKEVIYQALDIAKNQKSKSALALSLIHI